jgi:hypothetical protein
VSNKLPFIAFHRLVAILGFLGVAPQHLQAYLNESTFRFNRRFYLLTPSSLLAWYRLRCHHATYAELYAKKSRPTISNVVVHVNWNLFNWSQIRLFVRYCERSSQNNRLDL